MDLISADGIGYVAAARTLASGNLNGLTSNGFYVFLIWIFGLFTTDFETSGRLVSVVSGSLLVVPLYMLGSELFSRSTALAACLVAAFWPALFDWSCEVMTQATYTTLCVTGFYLVWRMCRDESKWFGFWAGLCMGLAFLTRTEAVLLFIVVPIFPLWMKPGNIAGKIRPVLAYVLAFTFLCGMHILMLRVINGSWQLSAKTSFALNDALGSYLQINDLHYIPGFEQTGYIDIITRYPGFIWATGTKNLVEAWQSIVPTPLWVLALLGFVANGFSKPANMQRLFLVSTFSPLFVIIVFFYIGPEYTQPYLPVLFLWCAEGLRMTEQKLTMLLPASGVPISRKITAAAPLTILAAGIYGTMLLLGQLPAQKVDMSKYSFMDDGARRDHKRIGLLLKSHLPPGKIMTRSGRIAYYADRDWMSIPNTDMKGILQTAANSGVRFLVLDGTLRSARPKLAELFYPLISDQYPERYFYVTDPEDSAIGSFILIYRDPSSVGVVVREIVR